MSEITPQQLQAEFNRIAKELKGIERSVLQTSYGIWTHSACIKRIRALAQEALLFSKRFEIKQSIEEKSSAQLTDQEVLDRSSNMLLDAASIITVAKDAILERALLVPDVVQSIRNLVSGWVPPKKKKKKRRVQRRYFGFYPQ